MLVQLISNNIASQKTKSLTDQHTASVQIKLLGVTWKAEEAVPNMKRTGKLLRLRDETLK